MFNNIFISLENLAVYQIMRQNNVEPGRPQKTKRRMLIV